MDYQLKRREEMLFVTYTKCMGMDLILKNFFLLKKVGFVEKSGAGLGKGVFK